MPESALKEGGESGYVHTQGERRETRRQLRKTSIRNVRAHGKTEQKEFAGEEKEREEPALLGGTRK